MQYVQRKLQRSVTDILKSSRGRDDLSYTDEPEKSRNRVPAALIGMNFTACI